MEMGLELSDVLGSRASYKQPRVRAEGQKLVAKRTMCRRGKEEQTRELHPLFWFS